MSIPPDLQRELNLAQPDDIYNLLIDGHKGLTREQSESMNARLVLLLANHIGDDRILRQAVVAARSSIVQT